MNEEIIREKYLFRVATCVAIVFLFAKVFADFGLFKHIFCAVFAIYGIKSALQYVGLFRPEDKVNQKEKTKNGK